MLALLATLLLLAPSATEDARAAAREHVAAKRFEEAAHVLGEHLRREAGDLETHELYASVLTELGRDDEAAFQLEEALRLVAEAPRTDKQRAAALARSLQKVDPLARKRESLVAAVVDSFGDLAEKLFEEGHAERALDLLERLLPDATGKDRARLLALHEEVRAVFEQVALDGAGATGGGAPLVVHESEFYRFEANLEREVVELLGVTMDDVFRYFVELFFDGKAKKAQGRKVTIRVHADHETMAADYPGGAGGGVLGWWSPGEWRIVTFDTRSRGQSLNDMLPTLFHEAAHHFMTMFSGGTGVPSWFNEGTACFFEGAVAMADHRVLWPDAARPRLFTLASELSNGTGPSLDQVVGYTGAGSYPGDYYPFGWGLIYFLQQYEDPTTLEYVWRPYYARYRDEVLGKTERSRALFEEVLLEKGNPGGFEEFDAWIDAWRAWIVDEVHPQHFGRERTARRRARMERYLRAADGGESGVTVDEDELLLRALEQIEFLRRDEGEEPEAPDVELALLEVDVLERLRREGGAAARIEQVLAWSEEGRVELDDARRADLESRMAKLDRRNAPLRTLRLREKSFRTRAAALLKQYEARDESLLLRSFTFARRVGRLLDDVDGLLARAPELRARAVEAGRVPSRIVRVEGTTWTTVFPSEPKLRFEVEGRTVELAIPGRPGGRVCEDVSLGGSEYELRATLVADGEGFRSSFWGLVVAGAPGRDWFAVGVDGKGALNLRQVALDSTGAPRTKLLGSSDQRLAPEVGEPWELAVRVSPDGALVATLGAGTPAEVRWRSRVPDPLTGLDHAGVLVKDAAVRVEDLRVELFP